MSAFGQVVRVVRVKQHCTRYGEYLITAITLYGILAFDPDDPDDLLENRCFLRFCSSGSSANVRVDPDSRPFWASADSRNVSNVRGEANSTLTRYVLGDADFSRARRSFWFLKRNARTEVCEALGLDGKRAQRRRFVWGLTGARRLQ